MMPWRCWLVAAQDAPARHRNASRHAGLELPTAVGGRPASAGPTLSLRWRRHAGRHRMCWQSCCRCSSGHPPGLGATGRREPRAAPRVARSRVALPAPHETVRQYAAERLVELAEVDHTRRRHALLFRDLAEEGRAHLHGPEQAAWLDGLTRARQPARCFALGRSNRGMPSCGAPRSQSVGVLVSPWSCP